MIECRRLARVEERHERARHKANRRITAALKPLAYERLYGAFQGLTGAKDAKAAVARSAARYLKAISA